jgi:hypothetical protein
MVQHIVQFGQNSGFPGSPKAFDYEHGKVLAPQRTVPFGTHHEISDEVDHAIQAIDTIVANRHAGTSYPGSA